MQMFVFLLLLLGFAALADTSSDQRVQGLNDQASALATQMSWYHTQAVKTCQTPNVCAPGPIPIARTSLPPGASGNYSSRYASATDGTIIVTTWIPGGTSFGQAPLGLGGLVASALRQQSGGSINAGAYNAAAQTINGVNPFTYGGNTGTEATPTFPPSFGGLTLSDGAPVLLSYSR